MAKINVSYDTSEKKMTCSIDGVELPDVMEVMLAKYSGDEVRCSIMQRHDMPEDKMVRYSQLVAKESIDGKSVGEHGLKTPLEDFVFVPRVVNTNQPSEQIEKDIHRYMMEACRK